MNQLEMFGQDVDPKFIQYHQDNPQIYKAFEAKTFEAIRKGFKHYGSKGIFEQIRWQTGVEPGGDGFKVNNIYTPYYSRLFEFNNPEFKGFFRRRGSKFDKVITK